MLCVARHQPAICESRSRASLVRSTATARLWQRKGRCIRVKLACKMTRGPPRLHSPAFSRLRGVNRDTRRPLRTRRNAHLRAARQTYLASKQVLLAKWGVKVGALSADLASRLGWRLIQTLRKQLSSLRLRRDETATHSEPPLLLAARAQLLR